jgi:hypothetical protein
MELVRDRFWIWGHEAGSHGMAEWGVPEPSRITPVEGAHYMGIPNIILVRYNNKPAPPYQQYALPFKSLKKVVWSIVGAGGFTQDEDRAKVLEIPQFLPNMTGVMMDDFFRDSHDENTVGTLSVSELENMRKLLKTPKPKLDLWVVLYDHQLDKPVTNHLKYCDTVAFWLWQGENIRTLESIFDKAEKVIPKKAKKVLGCYMWDYGPHRPMPLDLMEKQCELGLKWLKQGRIEGMIFLASCICDLELEAVEWTRKWIAEVGDKKLI